MSFRALPESQIKKLLFKKQNPFVFLESSAYVKGESKTYLFDNFEHILTFKSKDDPDEFFKELDSYLNRGYWAAGYFSYELGYYLEEALSGLRKDYGFDLAWFGLTKKPLVVDRLIDGEVFKDVRQGGNIKNIKPNISKAEYKEAIKAIKHYLEEGDAYQVNFTFRVAFDYEGDPLDLYSQLRKKQPTAYSAFINTGREHFLSHSPELFFKREAVDIITRPMKGTVARGLTPKEDKKNQNDLKTNEKTRAENIMIVDLLRNDLGRVSSKVWAPKLFEVQRHKTLHQMTSTVEAKLKISLSWKEFFCGVFPSGSVTGAPKIRTMQIIEELEKSSRNIYTGAIGFLSPDKKACFNVAIRTIHIKNKKGEIGVGGGIVYDSVDEDEYKEAMLKADFLLQNTPQISLIETLRFDKGRGFCLKDLHLSRLAKSCEYFLIPFNQGKILKGLEKQIHHKTTTQKVRLLVNMVGEIFTETADLPELPKEPKIKISKKIISKNNIYLYHKTTERQMYDQELFDARSNGFFEVIFVNRDRQITEGSFTNIFLEKNKKLYTSTLSCGLLPGVLRESLLKEGKVLEKELYTKDLLGADAVYVGNSVRGLVKVEVVVEKGAAFDRMSMP